MKADEINQEQIKREVEDVFKTYEAALVGNDIEVLDRLFWHSTHTVRYGVSENLYGIEAIRAFRKARTAIGLARLLVNTRITTFGSDFAVTNTEFFRESQAVGRQTQTWVRFSEGWRIVSAHVSQIKDSS